MSCVPLDLTGEVHGYLRALSPAGKGTDTNGSRLWNVFCAACGNTVVISAHSFHRNTSCGCRAPNKTKLRRLGNYENFIMVVARKSAKDVEDHILKGGNVNAKDDLGRTPLHWAAQYNTSPEVIGILLNHGADVNALQKYSISPLMYAASWNPCVGVTKALLDAGADVNARDYKGRTPLLWATSNQGNLEVLEALLDAGANPDVRTAQGMSILQFVDNRVGKFAESRDRVREFLTQRGVL